MADPKPANATASEKSPARTSLPPPRQRKAIRKVKPKIVSAIAKDKHFPMAPLSPSPQASLAASPRAPSASYRPTQSEHASSAIGSHHGEEQQKTTAAPIAQAVFGQ